VIAFVLIVTGTALLSFPVALIVAGVLLLVIAVLIFDAVGSGGP
jgi:hypothetical protein